MEDETFFVSWKDFEANSPELIRNLWNDEDFSDVTLASGDGKQFRAHRFILSSATTKLKSILRNPEKCEKLFLYLPDIQSGHLSNLLEFIYQGKCQVKQADLEEFMSCGRTLGVKNLTGTLKSIDTDSKPENHPHISQNPYIGVSEEGKRDFASTESTDTFQPMKESGTSSISSNIERRHCSLCAFSLLMLMA